MSRYISTLKVYGLRLGDRTTSLRIEPELWESLEEIAFFEGCTIADIADRARRGYKTGSLVSRLRLFMLDYFRERTGQVVPRRMVQDGLERVEQRELPLDMAGEVD